MEFWNKVEAVESLCRAIEDAGLPRPTVNELRRMTIEEFAAKYADAGIRFTFVVKCKTAEDKR